MSILRLIRKHPTPVYSFSRTGRLRIKSYYSLTNLVQGKPRSRLTSPVLCPASPAIFYLISPSLIVVPELAEADGTDLRPSPSLMPSITRREKMDKYDECRIFGGIMTRATIVSSIHLIDRRRTQGEGSEGLTPSRRSTHKFDGRQASTLNLLAVAQNSFTAELHILSADLHDYSRNDLLRI
uniref:Uncharacterized protein n=1 Tax=Kwoniella dejecticola CBS 10117 TaxID=1296121 RepID=A0A1A6A9W8_9TREE|nr:uncharacterized protein I303_02876 [Kwoniella dejecticola CBS 10117]OBR86857.1 hypothetical protein I303_02876 [Kwoniella dejecticola CBS 10117]